MTQIVLQLDNSDTNVSQVQAAVQEIEDMKLNRPKSKAVVFSTWNRLLKVMEQTNTGQTSCSHFQKSFQLSH